MVLQRMKECYSFDSALQMTLIGILHSAETVSILSFVDDLQSIGHTLSLNAYLKIAAKFANRDATLIPDLLQGMVKAKVVPNSRFTHKIITQLCSSGNSPQAAALIQQFEEIGTPVSSRTYNGLIESLCSQDSHKELMQTFALMQSRKVEANVHTYNSLIRYFCRKDLLPAAEKCFTRMVESGIPPTEKTFLLLLEAYCRLRKYEQAVKFLDNLIDSDIKISIITFTELIKDLCSGEQPKLIDLALNVLQRMKDVGVEDRKSVV